MTADYETEAPDIPGEWQTSFRQGYARAMLWANTRQYSSPQDEGTEVDPAGWQDDRDPEWAMSAFTPQSQAMIRDECGDFAAGNWGLLEGMDAEQAGHDFALTRNGHGAGFWDRGLGEVGDKLTEAAKVCGESSAWMRDGEDRVRLFDEPAVLGADGKVIEREAG